MTPVWGASRVYHSSAVGFQRDGLACLSAAQPPNLSQPGLPDTATAAALGYGAPCDSQQLSVCLKDRGAPLCLDDRRLLCLICAA